MVKSSKKGLPKSVQEALEREEDSAKRTESLEEFVRDLHGEEAVAVSDSNMPSKEWLQDQFKTKSAVIRYLVNQGHAVKDIAKHLGMRYQHVNNVAHAPLKRGPNEDWRKPYLEGRNIPN